MGQPVTEESQEKSGDSKTVSPPLAMEADKQKAVSIRFPVGCITDSCAFLESLCEGHSKIARALADERQQGYRRGLLEAAEIAVEVRADANGKLGLVPGNLAFENGRAKAAEEIAEAIRSRISGG